MATSSSMHNLTTLIKRLEAATMRLEDIAESTIALSPQTTGNEPLTAIPPITQSNITGAPPNPPPTALVPPPPAPKPVAEPLPEAIEEFDNFIDTSVGKYVKLSNQIGGLLAEQANKVLQGFKEERKFLLLATKAKKPDINGEGLLYQELIKPINDALMAVIEIKEQNRGSPFLSHLSTVSEGIMLVAWVTVENRPWKHVEECLGPAQFFGNRVLKDAKDREPTQVEWVKAFYQVFRDLTDYVKQYYSNGILWNAKGKSAAEILRELSAASTIPAAPSGGAPPPPPPPPPGPAPILNIDSEPASSQASKNCGGFGAVFSELNKGADITKGLKKVDKSQMTHKNPALRVSSTVPDGSTRGKSPAPGKKPKPESMRVKKPSRKVLEDNKWMIENFEKEQQPIIIEASISQSILISKCNHTTIVVKGKANTITVESTKRVSLVVDDLISTVDVVKSNNFALQVMGSVPTVLMDQIDSAELYFSKESCETRVFSSNASNINIMVPNEDDDYKELPIPSQICSYFDKEKNTLINEIVTHSG